MKKLKLDSLDLGGVEVLSRAELKSITGGLGSFWLCVCPDGSFYQCIGGTEAACQSKSPSECGAGNTATCSQEFSILG